MGYREKDGQNTKFGHWYAERVQDAQYRDAPWCDMFIAWAADRAGIVDHVGSFAWTPSHAAWFIKQGAWSSTPEPGALVFFDWKGGKSYQGIDHVGIVESVSGGKIHTIEANVDRVWLKRKVRETDKVVGYGLPRLVKADATPSEIRATEHPFAPAPRAREPQGSVFDVLGTPHALLAVMVLTTIVLSLRFAGRRRGTHRRLAWPWNAPSRGDHGLSWTDADPTWTDPDPAWSDPDTAWSGPGHENAGERVPVVIGGPPREHPAARRRPYESRR
ncbi:CHAP domain-containing protein [Nonomuraea sp. NPDC050691]|uniref:CHAP domain-containing protein n=1 Tax=Nonomuraea sp. NPDC050691 TaxID=3155661 RepID=UPI0033F08F98